MISNCPFDQAVLIGNHCPECNRLFFNPKDMVVVEIDIDHYLAENNPSFENESDKIAFNRMVFQAISDQWNSAHMDQPFLIGSVKLLTKVTRHIVTNDHSRWNIEEVPDSGDLLICEGEHGKMEPCEYDRYRMIAEEDHNIEIIRRMNSALRNIDNLIMKRGDPMIQELLDESDEIINRVK